MDAKRTHYDFSCFPDPKKRTIASCLGSSSSSSTTHRWSHDLFLSFRGEDTRKNFTDHLYTALVRAGIHTFRDDEELRRGHQISWKLLKSIEESRISIVVFSRNYASSRWCLDELVKIMECKKTTGQLVFPIFYNVDPSQVRNQTGCFAEAFERHQKRFVNEREKVQSWRAALTEAANLSGYDLQNVENGHEARVIQNIVEDVLCEVNYTFLNVAVHPIGIESRVEDIKLLFSTGSDDVRMIGIYGLGGIGKTTIAKAVYNHIFRPFEGSCFLANIREVAGQPNGLIQLQEQLLFELLRIKNPKIGSADRGMNLIKERLHSKRVLIVLDDVDQLSQLNSLAGNRDWFGSGSKVIITTKDKRLLEALKVDETYMAKELNHAESLQLFSWHAFRRTNPLKNYAELANDIVSHVGGLPLALEVLGSSLFERDMLEWESAFDKLQQILPSEIQKKLRISFDALDDKMKNIFLDIACFFIGMDKDYAITILDGCGFFSKIGISDLISKCLLRIDGNMLTMHDLLRDMGREIVREESTNDLRKRSRLWFHEDVYNVLEENEENKTCSSAKLKHFGMMASTWKSLKILNLSNSNSLTKILNFNAVPRLEKLVLESCTSLMKIHESIGFLDRLVHLNVKDCMNLKYLPGSICKLKSTEYLNISGCTKLEELPEHLGHMERLTELLVDGTSIKQLPFSIGQLKNLRTLSLEGFNRRLPTKSWLPLISSWVSRRKNSDSIIFLPFSISTLCSLTKLVLKDCNLSEGNFQVDLGNLSSLKDLNLSGNNFRSLPYSVSHLSMLKTLQLGDCRSLQSISNLPPNLRNLHADGCTSLEKISNLPNLKWLNLVNYYYFSSNHIECPVKELQCFQGAPIIPEDRSNNIRFPLQHPRYIRGITDDFSHGSDLPDHWSLKITGSSICAEVPVLLVNCVGYNFRIYFGAVFTVEDECSMELTAAPYAIFRDKTNGVEWTYTPIMCGIPRSYGDYVWQSLTHHDYFGRPFKGGEQLEVSFITWSPVMHVKNCAINIF